MVRPFRKAFKSVINSSLEILSKSFSLLETSTSLVDEVGDSKRKSNPIFAVDTDSENAACERQWGDRSKNRKMRD